MEENKQIKSKTLNLIGIVCNTRAAWFSQPSNTEQYVNDMRFFPFAAAIVLSMVDCRRFIHSTMMMHGTHASNVTVAHISMISHVKSESKWFFQWKKSDGFCGGISQNTQYAYEFSIRMRPMGPLKPTKRKKKWNPKLRKTRRARIGRSLNRPNNKICDRFAVHFCCIYFRITGAHWMGEHFIYDLLGHTDRPRLYLSLISPTSTQSHGAIESIRFFCIQ